MLSEANAIKMAVSEKVGVVKSIYRIPIDVGDPKVYVAAAEMCDTRYLGSKLRHGRPGGGAALNEDEAVVAAVGEVIERYCAIVPQDRKIIFGSYNELVGDYPVVSPERFALFSELQYRTIPFVPFTKETRVSWCCGLSLITGKDVWLPEQRVYWSFSPYQRQDNLGPLTSTGLAAGASIKEAILFGLYESLERDAFAIFWLNQLPVELYDIQLAKNHSTNIMKVINEKFLIGGHEYIVARLPIDHGIPIFCSIFISSSPRLSQKVYAIGAACRIDPEEALLKAMIESVQGKGFIIQKIFENPDWKATEDFSNIISFDLHAQLYTRYPEMASNLLRIKESALRTRTLDDIIEESRKLKCNSIDQKISRLCKLFEDMEYEVVMIDLTTPDVFQMGMRVVRVLIPELVSLHGDHRYPFLGSRRVYDVPEILGFQRNTEDMLNPYPHPFP